MQAWNDVPAAKLDRPKGIGWVLLFIRVILIIFLISTLFLFHILLSFFGMKNLCQLVVKYACIGSLKIAGLKLKQSGVPMSFAGAVVANHSSWLDIFVLNATQKIYFVSKSEVKKWPLIGKIANHVGTVFIRRSRIEAIKQKNIFLKRISSGDKLLFFPEGTSTDGMRILPFKSTLFAAFFEEGLPEISWIQPVTLNYIAPETKRADWYGWWADMGFFPSVMMVLSHMKQGEVELVFHDPLYVKEFRNRKELAHASEQAIRNGLLIC